MASVAVSPELVVQAAADIAEIGSSISTANTSAAAAITDILPAGLDEVSGAIAEFLGQYGLSYQTISAQLDGWQRGFVKQLIASANSYLTAEQSAQVELALSEAYSYGYRAALQVQAFSDATGISIRSLIHYYVGDYLS